MLSSHLPCDADKPRPEPIGLPQPPEVPVRPQETLLGQVAGARGACRHPVHDGPDQARVAVVEAAERVAVAGANSRDQFHIRRLVGPQHQKTSDRRRRIVQDPSCILKRTNLCFGHGIAPREYQRDPDLMASYIALGRSSTLGGLIGQVAIYKPSRESPPRPSS